MVTVRPGLALSVLALIQLGAEGAWAAGEREAAIQRLHEWTGLPARSAVAVTPEMVVALLGRGAPGKSPGQLDGVELQGEVLDEAFAQARGWRSMRLKVDVDCRDGGATWVRRMTVYPQHGHAGAGHEATTPAGWVTPKPEAYLGQVVSVVCGPPGAQAVVQASMPSLRPAEAPAPEPSGPPPVLRPAFPRPDAPPLAAPAAEPAHAAVAQAAQAAPPTGGVMVQITASPDEAEAQRAFSGPAKSLAAADPRLNFHVEPALSNGRKVYRALVSGFSDRAAAQRWCAALRSAGGACFLR